jgi:hypothetical protein
MRLILSRKGFDSASGGCPSPIFPDGSMLALPIPDTSSTIRYDALSWNGRNLGELVERLTRGRQRRGSFAHLDPDLRAGLMPREPGWRAALGQEGASQSHLRNQGVREGDLFLFWGLFRRVGEDLSWSGRPFHAIWGWLQVARAADVSRDVLPAVTSEQWSWAATHPHVRVRDGEKVRREPNCLYVATERLSLPGLSRRSASGAGVFESFRPALQLTADPETKLSVWSLPACFSPGARSALTFHSSRDRWTPHGERVLLETVGRGQEFVLDLDAYPQAFDWIAALFRGP